jgi:hypothetical protein
MADGIEIEVLLPLIDQIVDRVRDVSDELVKARRDGLPISLGLFPNFDEMSRIQEAATRAEVNDAGAKILAMLPAPVAAAFGPVESREQGLLNHVIAAVSYPDLFKRPRTPQQIAEAFRDLAAGYVTVLTVTFLRGIRPPTPVTLGGCTIGPAASFDSFWFRSQVPWGTMVPLGFGHAIIFREERIRSDKLTDEDLRTEPTSSAVQSLRLAASSDVLSIGSMQRGLVFDPMILRGPAGGLGSGTRWWAAPHSRHRAGCLVLTDEHLKEAEFLGALVADADGVLAVPIRRLDMAMKRPEPKDQLVDLAVSAEALFLADSEKEVLTYRLKMRASRVLALPEKREEMRTWISDIYDLRSAIVHGDREPSKKRLRPILSDDKRLSDEVRSFAELVRRGIRLGARLVNVGQKDLPSLFDQLLLATPATVALFDSIAVPELPEERLDEGRAIFLDFPPSPQKEGASSG